MQGNTRHIELFVAEMAEGIGDGGEIGAMAGIGIGMRPHKQDIGVRAIEDNAGEKPRLFDTVGGYVQLAAGIGESIQPPLLDIGEEAIGKQLF